MLELYSECQWALALHSCVMPLIGVVKNVAEVGGMNERGVILT